MPKLKVINVVITQEYDETKPSEKIKKEKVIKDKEKVRIKKDSKKELNSVEDYTKLSSKEKDALIYALLKLNDLI